MGAVGGMGVTIFRPGQRLIIPGVIVMQPRPSAGGAVVGILDDISNVAAAYALRQLRSAYAGSAVRVRRSSDDAEQDIGFVAGEFDSGAFSSFVGGGSGYVKTWYDQSGNGRDTTQATEANQPQIVLSVVNSKPIVRFNGTSTFLRNTFGATASQPNTIIMQLNITGPSGGGPFVIDGVAVGNRHNINPDINPRTLYFYAGTLKSYSQYPAAAHIQSAIFNGASSKTWQNGVNKISSDLGSHTLTGITIGASYTGILWCAMDMSELIILNSSISTAIHNTIGNDMATRYGLSWSTVT